MEWRIYTTSYQMNEANQRKQLTYPSSRVENYSYDSKGMLNATSDLNDITYNIGGQITSWRIGTTNDNITGSYSYDTERLQMTNQTVTRTVIECYFQPSPPAVICDPVTTTLMDVDYDYEASAGETGASTTAGNAGQLMGISGTMDSQSESAAYTYDNVGRLVTSSQTTSGASAQRRFVYDRWGNRTGVWNAVTGGSQIQSVTLVESSSIPNNRIESVTENSATSDYTYDAAGNVTDDDVNTFVYDAENRLVSINSGAEQYKYDHQNRRVAKTVGSVTTQYVWEGSKVIAEHAASSGNVLVDYVFMGGRMVKKVEGSTTRYIVSDRLSARMMLDEDYDVAGKQSHLPFGEAMATSGEQEKHHFTSYERDSSTGLDYAVNRWHSSGVGRFLQADPITGDVYNPQRLNRFAYTMNNPINLVDSLGLDNCPVPTEPRPSGPQEDHYVWDTETCQWVYTFGTTEDGEGTTTGEDGPRDMSEDLPRGSGGGWIPFVIEGTNPNTEGSSVGQVGLDLSRLRRLFNARVDEAIDILENNEDCRNLLSSDFVPAQEVWGWVSNLKRQGKIKFTFDQGDLGGSTATATTSTPLEGLPTILFGPLWFGRTVNGHTTWFPNDPKAARKARLIVIFHELGHATKAPAARHGASHPDAFEQDIINNCL